MHISRLIMVDIMSLTMLDREREGERERERNKNISVQDITSNFKPKIVEQLQTKNRA